jgi:hypothetical protein
VTTVGTNEPSVPLRHQPEFVAHNTIPAASEFGFGSAHEEIKALAEQKKTDEQSTP